MSAEVKNEAALLMNKIRYLLRDDWEFQRLVRYVREHHDDLADAGEKIVDISDLL